MKQIRIKIMPDGKIEAETVGIKGKQCLKYLQTIEKMADAVTEASAFTRDYYDRDEDGLIISNTTEANA